MKTFVVDMNGDYTCEFCLGYDPNEIDFGCLHSKSKGRRCQGDLNYRPEWCPLIEVEKEMVLNKVEYVWIEKSIISKDANTGDNIGKENHGKQVLHR